MSDWEEAADGWDTDEATRAYAAAAFLSLTELLAPLTLADMNVLDFGCGTGLITERLVSAGVARVVAVDTSPAMLAVLDAKSEDWPMVETSLELPTDGPGFDLIVCSSVMAFVNDYPATVATLVATLVPGGRFVQWDWERVDDDPHGLSRAEIADALTAAGLDDIDIAVAFEAEAHGQTMRPLMGSGQRSSAVQ